MHKDDIEGSVEVSRTKRKDLDGRIVRDGRQYRALNEHTDPWDMGVPYKEKGSRKSSSMELRNVLSDIVYRAKPSDDK